MINGPEPGGLDSTTDRLGQGILAVLLLGAFVFHLPAMVPVLTVLVVTAAVVGPRADLAQRIGESLRARQERRGDGGLDPSDARLHAAVLGAALLLASLLLFTDLDLVGWLFTIAAAGIAAVAASTGVHLAGYARTHWRGR